jgi:radical SAM family uncharacterized protein
MGNLQELVSDQLLPYVSTPGQYVGGEINQLPQPGDWESAQVRVAVAFPDAYTIGMSHLGCQIIYWLCNHTEGVTAERVYCPWVDAEAVMRKKKIPLFTWDTRRPVSEVDILAISLQYEMGFTNILTLLDLANIPLRSADRDDSHPLVIGGGPQSDNPEPVADFIDLIVLGDGEESMAAILSAYKEYKANGVPRREMIRLMARRFPWAYAPSLYEVTYNSDNTIRSVTPREEGLRDAIVRCQTPDFGNAPFPVRPLVPHVRVVQDRISIEIMRGCPQRCRFCHAGYTKRPIGRRTVDEILAIAEEAYRATGHTEIGLLSLSTADYPYLPELAERIDKQFTHRQVSISVPSMRVDKMLANIPWLVNGVRKSGLTIAVEAARDDMRAAIRKVVTDGNLIDGVTQAYKAGWKSVKLYFMAGFPGERPDDIDGIMDISREVSRARIPVAGHPAAVNSAVGWLVPKPHTPFQWAAQPQAEYFHEVRRRLRMMERSRKSAVRIKMHNVERSVLEAVFSRGDRKLGPVIERAWRDGARFDGWDEQFDNRIWDRAFEAEGVDPAWYAHRERPDGEVFPWSHLAGGNSEGYLKKQYDDVFVQINSDGPSLSLVSAAAG